MADETATNPVEGGDTSVLDTEAQTQEVEQQAEEGELDEFGEPIAREPEDEEIDLDDLKLKVPKDQAQKVREALLRQADYTRKTQALAESQKALEAERASVQQASQAEIGALAQVSAIDQQLAQYQRVDWTAWENEDPFAAQSGWREYQQLKDARGQAAGQYSHLVQQRTLQAKQEADKRLEAGRAQLAREIKGWSDDLGAQLLDTGVKQYGFERGEIEESFDDPRLIKVLHDAHQFHLLNKKTKQAQSHEAAQTAKPAAKAGGGSAPAQGLDDRLTAEEWTRRREAQLRKRAGR